MYCRNCGAQISEHDRFCEKCGAGINGGDIIEDQKAQRQPGGFYRFCVGALLAWTALWAGLTFSAFGLLGKQTEASAGAMLGFGLGLGFYALFWGVPAVVLGITAIATRPAQLVRWSASRKIGTLLACVLLFLAGFSPGLIRPRGVPQDGQPLTTDTHRGSSVMQTKSEIDGSPTVMLALTSDEQIQGWLKSQSPQLVVRCMEKSTDVYIISGMPANPEFGHDSFTVRTRVDDRSPTEERWTESTDQKALFSPSPKELAKALAGSRQFVFQFTPFQSNPATARFNTQGLDELLEKVAVPCGWGKAQEAEKAREAEKSEQERKQRELEHLRQWRLHVDVKALDYNIVDLHFSSDQGSESEINLGLQQTAKHIDGNDQVMLTIDSPDKPSALKVTVNGEVWPEGNWRRLRDPRFDFDVEGRYETVIHAKP